MKNLERRGFLGALSGSFAGALAFSKLFNSDNAKAQTWFQSASNIIQNPNDVKINVKMVYSSSIHSDSWEGPCRAGGGSFGDKERAAAQAGFNRWIERTNENISPYANMLKPELVEFSYISTIIEQNEKEFAKLEADRDEVDLYFVSDSNLTQSLSAAVGKRFKKPVAMGPSGGTRIYCGAAHLRARGYEAYPCLDYEDLNSLINLLRTRKVFQQLNMLIVTDEPLPSFSSSSAVWDFEDLQSRFGIRTKIINNKVLSEEMERVIQDNNEQKRAQTLTNDLIKNATACYLDKGYVFNSALFYYTVKNLMERYCCNAFSIDCWEFCASRLPEKWKITPCLVHTLLNDEGYVGACHNLINGLLALRLTMTLTNKSAYLSGTHTGSTNEEFMIGHNTPGIKANGFDKPGLPFNLQHFCNSGWGTKVLVDHPMGLITLVAVNPLANRIHVTLGEITKTRGYEKQRTGCTQDVYITFPSSQKFSPTDYTREYMHLMANFGTHSVMVYGDYIEDFKRLGPMLGMEVLVGKPDSFVYTGHVV